MSKLKLSLLLPTSPLPLASLIAFLYMHSQEEGMGHTQPVWMGSILRLSQIVPPASLASPYAGAAPTPSLASTGNLGPHVHLLHSRPTWASYLKASSHWSQN